MPSFLLVHREPEILNNLADKLRKHGADVTAEQHPANAICVFSERRFSAALLGIPGLAEGEGQSESDERWFYGPDIEVAGRLHDANPAIPLAAITVATDEQARSRIRQAGVTGFIQRAQPISRIADEVMQFAGIARRQVGTPHPVAPVVEKLAAVDYALTKCDDFLRATADYDRLCALWTISQLAELLDDKVVRVVLGNASRSSDFRIRAEACYLATRAGMHDPVFLRPFLTDPHPAVQEAVKQHIFAPLGGAAPIDIRAPVGDFWRGLATIQEKQNRIMQINQAGMTSQYGVSNTVKQVFRAWLAHHPTPDAKDFFAGARALSAKDIVAEVEQESELGVEHIKMLMSALLRGGGSHGS